MSERQPKAVASDTKQTTTYRRDNPCGCPQFLFHNPSASRSFGTSLYTREAEKRLSANRKAKSAPSGRELLSVAKLRE